MARKNPNHGRPRQRNTSRFTVEQHLAKAAKDKRNRPAAFRPEYNTIPRQKSHSHEIPKSSGFNPYSANVMGYHVPTLNEEFEEGIPASEDYQIHEF